MWTWTSNKGSSLHATQQQAIELIVVCWTNQACCCSKMFFERLHSTKRFELFIVLINIIIVIIIMIFIQNNDYGYDFANDNDDNR